MPNRKPEPLRVRSGNVELPITQLPDGRWRCRYKDEAGKWKALTYADATKAKTAVQNLADRLAGNQETVTLSKFELAEFRAWRAQQATGSPLAQVAEAFEQAQARKRRRGNRWLVNQMRHINRMVEHFGGDRAIGSITTAELENLIHTWPDFSDRTRHHFRAQIVQFWRFARDHDMISPTNRVAEKTSAIEFDPGKKEIFSPDECRKSLEAVRPDYLPYVLLSLFAGIRSEELRPDERSGKPFLQWQSIDLENGIIIIPAEIGKGRARKGAGRRRIIPIRPNLALWLDSINAQNRIGNISPNKSFTHYQNKNIMKAIGLDKWPRNVLRHSYGSYRMAITRDAPRVSEEMGNSPVDIRTNYDAVVRESEAREFWSITPIKSGLKVVNKL